MNVPYQYRGLGSPYNGFGELRPPVGRSQDEIRADLADRAALAERQRTGNVASFSETQPVGVEAAAAYAGAVAMSTQELHGAGPTAEQAAVQVPDVVAQLGVHAQIEVA